MIKYNNKRTDARVFMLCYNPKEYSFEDNKLITPLQCGAASNPVDACELKDNTGENISIHNWFFVENTGIYWIWKNVKDAKYKGQMQYRRRIELDSNTNFDEIFKKYDVICAEPFVYDNKPYLPADSVENGFKFSHNIDDLKRLESIVNRYYPEYYQSYKDNIINGNKLYYSNSFILPAEEYDKYCEFLFTLLNLWLKETGITAKEDMFVHVTRNLYRNKYVKYGPDPNRVSNGEIKWQTELGGFLSERIFTLWITHNYKNFLILPYIKTEGQLI